MYTYIYMNSDVPFEVCQVSVQVGGELNGA